MRGPQQTQRTESGRPRKRYVLLSIGLLLFGTTGAVLDLLPPVTVFTALLWGLINLVFSVGLFRVQRDLSHRRRERPSSHEESPHVPRSPRA
jgi:hypothetical protein